MSSETIKIIITAVLLLHGVAHARASVTLLVVAAGLRTGAWIPVRSWLFPSLSQRAAAAVASLFYIPSAVGFLAAALSFWGIIVPGDLWRQLTVAAAVISTLGIALFSGIWPGAPDKRLSTIDTVIALVVNLVVFVTILWMQWPPYEMFGK
jgi:hypothetical protein